MVCQFVPFIQFILLVFRFILQVFQFILLVYSVSLKGTHGEKEIEDIKLSKSIKKLISLFITSLVVSFYNFSLQYLLTTSTESTKESLTDSREKMSISDWLAIIGCL